MDVVECFISAERDFTGPELRASCNDVDHHPIKLRKCGHQRRAQDFRLRVVCEGVGVSCPVVFPLDPLLPLNRLLASPTVGTFSSFISTSALAALPRPFFGTGFLYVAK